MRRGRALVASTAPCLAACGAGCLRFYRAEPCESCAVPGAPESDDDHIFIAAALCPQSPTVLYEGRCYKVDRSREWRLCLPGAGPVVPGGDCIPFGAAVVAPPDSVGCLNGCDDKLCDAGRFTALVPCREGYAGPPLFAECAKPCGFYRDQNGDCHRLPAGPRLEYLPAGAVLIDARLLDYTATTCCDCQSGCSTARAFLWLFGRPECQDGPELSPPCCCGDVSNACVAATYSAYEEGQRTIPSLPAPVTTYEGSGMVCRVNGVATGPTRIVIVRTVRDQFGGQFTDTIETGLVPTCPAQASINVPLFPGVWGICPGDDGLVSFSRSVNASCTRVQAQAEQVWATVPGSVGVRIFREAWTATLTGMVVDGRCLGSCAGQRAGAGRSGTGCGSCGGDDLKPLPGG